MVQKYKALYRWQVKFGLSLSKEMFTLMKNLGWEYYGAPSNVSQSSDVYVYMDRVKRKHPSTQLW